MGNIEWNIPGEEMNDYMENLTKISDTILEIWGVDDPDHGYDVKKDTEQFVKILKGYKSLAD